MKENEVVDFTIVHLKMHVDLVDFVCPSGCGLVRDNHPVNKGNNIFVKCPKCKKVVSFQLQGVG